MCCLAVEVSAQSRDTGVPTTADINRPNNYPTRRTVPDPLKETLKVAILAGSEVSLEGRIVAVNAKENRFVVEQQQSKKRFNIPLNPKTELRADKQTELAGRKNLTIADFKPGQLIKVIYTLGPTVVEVRLRRDKTNKAQTTEPPRPDVKKSPDSSPVKPS